MAVIVTLVGSATDDGLPNPPGALTYQWSKVSGPGDVTFVDDTDPTTDVELSVMGVYVLRLTASDGVLNDADDMTITVTVLPPGMGLVEGVGDVVGIGINGHVCRTNDFQTASGSGGPTWDDVDLGTGNLYSWVVDPFSPGYLAGVGAINGWAVGDTDIFRLTDLFGTPDATSVFTFPVATVAASFHWRTIQASFGAFFPEDNPWLVCVNYYGNTVGHTGTWATRSTDGGVTWNDEVQISALYDSAAAVRFNPIGVYTSPRTPGLAYTVAHISSSSGPLPRWVEYDGAIGASGLGASASIISFSSGGPVIDKHLWFCPPPNTKRMVVEGEWRTIYSSPGGGACNSNIDVLDGTDTTLVDDLVHTVPTPDTSEGTTVGSYIATFTFGAFAADDWPVNTSNYLSGSNSDAARLRAYADTTSTAICTSEISGTVTEIELDDSTIYNPSALATALFRTIDYGAAWEQVDIGIDPGEAFAGTIHVPWPDNAAESLVYYGVLETDVVEGTADALMPMWAVMHEDNSLDLLGLSVSASWVVEAEEVGNQPGTVEDFAFLIIAPPKTAKRVVCSGVWSANKIRTGGTGNGSVDLDLETPTGGSRVDDLAFTQPSMPGGTSGSFTVTWTFLGADWPVNNESIVASPPATPAGARIRPYANANVTGSGGPWTVTTDVTITLTVTEIELDDSTIYTPVEASGGRSFKLKKTQDGVVTEISPSDGTRSYGVNRGPFGVRTHDSNRQYVVAGVIGNDTSGDADDDKHAVYISDNHGAMWTEVVAPMADTGAPAGRPAFEAAFGGDSQNIIFIWGPPDYISYSEDMGATVDSRAGNLIAFSMPGFIGIAGGPTGA